MEPPSKSYGNGSTYLDRHLTEEQDDGEGEQNHRVVVHELYKENSQTRAPRWIRKRIPHRPGKSSR